MAGCSSLVEQADYKAIEALKSCFSEFSLYRTWLSIVATSW